MSMKIRIILFACVLSLAFLPVLGSVACACDHAANSSVSPNSCEHQKSRYKHKNKSKHQGKSHQQHAKKCQHGCDHKGKLDHKKSCEMKKKNSCCERGKPRALNDSSSRISSQPEHQILLPWKSLSGAVVVMFPLWQTQPWRAALFHHKNRTLSLNQSFLC